MGTRGPSNERLWFFIRHVMEPSTECRIWPYSLTGPAGHGQIRFEGAVVTVNRLTCEAWHGPPPNDVAQAAHTCGTRGCWAGEHLRWATPVENEADKIIHGRSLQGERHHQARLSEADVISIRERFARGDITKRSLAREFGITDAQIGNIIRRRSWAHI